MDPRGLIGDIGGTIGGVIGIVTGPGAVGLAGLGVTLGMSIGAGLSLQADLQKVIDPQTVIDEVEMASAHGCCVDFDNEVYPVGWMPYIGDWGVKGGGMRSYDPTTIPGVGILVRVDTAPDGHKQLIGKQLMTGGRKSWSTRARRGTTRGYSTHRRPSSTNGTRATPSKRVTTFAIHRSPVVSRSSAPESGLSSKARSAS